MTSNDESVVPTYGRQLLLLGRKRNSVLELWEVLRYGTDTFGDANYLALYGMQPEEWYARGIRLLGRTAVECTPDHVARAIGRDVAAAARLSSSRALVIDPFAGSANSLYWILRNLPEAKGIGFELDPQVFQLTRQNLSIVESRMEFVHDDYARGLRQREVPDDALICAFVAPPWGDGFSQSDGLDLRGTTPPVLEIVNTLALLLPNPMLVAIQVVQNMVHESMTELTARFEWSALRIYESTKAGQNRNGLLLATRGWQPTVSTSLVSPGESSCATGCAEFRGTPPGSGSGVGDSPTDQPDGHREGEQRRND